MNWAEFEKLTKDLSVKVRTKPDIIVALVRGGLIPARLISSYLDVPRMFAITVEKIGYNRKVVSRIEANLKGLKILLIEDVLETGDCLQTAKQYLESCGASVETMAIYTTLQTKIAPTYSASQVPEVPKFPWE